MTKTLRIRNDLIDPAARNHREISPYGRDMQRSYLEAMPAVLCLLPREPADYKCDR